MTEELATAKELNQFYFKRGTMLKIQGTRYIKLLQIALGLLMVAVQFEAESAELEVECEKQWIKDSADFQGQKFEQLLTQWRSREGQCGSTLVYQGRLALIHIYLRDFANANAILANVKAGAAPYAYAVEGARQQLKVEERLADPKNITESDLIEFEAGYRQLVITYPNWPTGYALLGGVQTLLNKHKEAVKNLEKAEKGDVYDLSGVYRNLTISRIALFNYLDGLDAADKAIKLNKNLTSDTQFAIAVANANAGVGNLDDAANVLNVIMAKRPEVRNDPEFLKAVGFLRYQIDKQKKQ